MKNWGSDILRSHCLRTHRKSTAVLGLILTLELYVIPRCLKILEEGSWLLPWRSALVFTVVTYLTVLAESLSCFRHFSEREAKKRRHKLHSNIYSSKMITVAKGSFMRAMTALRSGREWDGMKTWEFQVTSLVLTKAWGRRVPVTDEETTVRHKMKSRR